MEGVGRHKDREPACFQGDYAIICDDAASPGGPVWPKLWREWPRCCGVSRARLNSNQLGKLILSNGHC